jgi:hypothetical protein
LGEIAEEMGFENLFFQPGFTGPGFLSTMVAAPWEESLQFSACFNASSYN